METTPTRRPWYVDDSTGLRIVADGVVICEVAPHAGGIGLANAHRIAAAPDLLEALQAVVKVADRATVEFDAARAAIARATRSQA